VIGVAWPTSWCTSSARPAGTPGNTDILREQPDGRVGKSEQRSAAFQEYDPDYRASKHAKAEQAAIAAGPAQA